MQKWCKNFIELQRKIMAVAAYMKNVVLKDRKI